MAWFGFIKLNNNRKTNYIPPVSWKHRGVSPEKVTKGPHKQRIIFQASFYSEGHVKFQMRSCIFTTEKINYILVGGFNPHLKKYARQKWLFETTSEYRWGPKRRWWGQKVCFLIKPTTPGAIPSRLIPSPPWPTSYHEWLARHLRHLTQPKRDRYEWGREFTTFPYLARVYMWGICPSDRGKFTNLL